MSPQFKMGYLYTWWVVTLVSDMESLWDISCKLTPDSAMSKNGCTARPNNSVTVLVFRSLEF
jgi:hypothetical protein